MAGRMIPIHPSHPYESSASSSMRPMRPHVMLFTDPLGINALQLHALARALLLAMPEAAFSFLGEINILFSLPQEGGVQLPVTCVISDAFTWIAESVPAEKVPLWIVFHCGFPLAIWAHVYAELFFLQLWNGRRCCKTAASQELLGYIPKLKNIRVCDLPDGILFGHNNAFHVKNMGKILTNADVVIVPSVQDFLDQNSFRSIGIKRGLPIGPLDLLSPVPPNSSNREDCLGWLDIQPALSVVYVCFGCHSNNTLPPAEHTNVALGLEDSRTPFLWSIKQEHRPYLPEGFEERTRDIGMLVSSAPHKSVLDHPAVALFVGFSGWKEVLQCLLAAVPILCRPLNGEERMVSRVVHDIWCVGVTFDGPIQRWWFSIAIEGIMRGAQGDQMRKSVHKYRIMTMGAMMAGGSLSNNFEHLLKIIRMEEETI
ncbi:UDP-glycosyltransferase 78D2 [Platanthera zijinensis]|uniref:UDP-glycosyltransferase 78D2 n=1 Tax=Platanthera zijinensis TaxID=2320716 RepID=A0AAP0GEE8_9ASPA